MSGGNSGTAMSDHDFERVRYVRIRGRYGSYILHTFLNFPPRCATRHGPLLLPILLLDDQGQPDGIQQCYNHVLPFVAQG